MVILPVTSCPGSRYDVRLLAVFRYRLSWFGLRNFANSPLAFRADDLEQRRSIWLDMPLQISPDRTRACN